MPLPHFIVKASLFLFGGIHMIGKIILFIFLMVICYFIYKTWCDR